MYFTRILHYILILSGYKLKIYYILTFIRPIGVPQNFLKFIVTGNSKGASALKNNEFFVGEHITSFPIKKRNTKPLEWNTYQAFAWMDHIFQLPTGEAIEIVNNRLQKWLTYGHRPNLLKIKEGTRRFLRLLMTAQIWMIYLPQSNKKRLLFRLNYQLFWFEKSYKLIANPKDRICTLCVLLLAKILFKSPVKEISYFERRLQFLLNSVLYPDGMINTRELLDHYTVFKYLVLLREGYENSQAKVPPFIQNVLDKMGPIIRFFILSDGKLSIFYNNYETNAEAIAWLLEKSESTGRPLSNLRFSGYVRMSTEHWLTVFDTGIHHNKKKSTGTTPITSLATGTGSFTLSIHGIRLLNNCGRPFHWNMDVSHLSLLQNTLHIQKTSLELLPHIQTFINEETYYYLSIFGKFFQGEYNRRIYIPKTKQLDLRGEETIHITKNVPKMDLHWHLHPSANITLLRNNFSAIIKCADIVVKFQSNTSISVSKSAYFGENGRYQPSQQLIIAIPPQIKQKKVIKWRIVQI